MTNDGNIIPWHLLPEQELTIDDVRDKIDKVLIREQIDKVLDTLPHRCKCVLVHRFYDELTLKETGSILGVHKERIRQIEIKSLRVLRHPTRNNPLKSIFLHEPISYLKKKQEKERLGRLKKQAEELKKHRKQYEGKAKAFTTRQEIKIYQLLPIKCPHNIILERNIAGEPYLATFIHDIYAGYMNPYAYKRWLKQRLEEEQVAII